MNIPKRFKLFSQTIVVTRNADDFVNDQDCSGMCCYRKNEIQLNPMMTYKAPEQLEHTFLHELTHLIIYHSQGAYGDKASPMHKDENFIDLTANLLHQALTTMEYE